MIKVTLQDGNGSGLGADVFDGEKGKGLVTYTHPRVSAIAQTKAFSNPTNGIDLNVDATFSGTPEGIHNGTDSSLWTASALSGTWTFNSTAQANTGTRSVDATATVNNSTAQFEVGSPITASNYVALTGFIYIASVGTGGGNKEVELRFRLAGVNVSDIVDLSDFVSSAVTGVWQKFTIPLEEFAISSATLDQLTVTTISTNGTPPDYYLDDIQLEEQGSAVYTVSADSQSIYKIRQLKITMADAYDSTLADASHQKIPYDSFLGVSSLDSGINFRLVSNEITRFDGQFRRHIDFVAFPGIEVESGGDGTNTWVSYDVTFDPPAVLDSRTKDTFTITLADDLSGLLYFRVFVRGDKEELDLTDRSRQNV